LFFHFVYIKLRTRQLISILKGFIYAGFGLFIFLLGVNGGLLDVGRTIGGHLPDFSILLVLSIGFLLGLLTIIAEPAVYVLTKQVEVVSSGYVSKKAMLFALSLGVGFAISISLLRIVVEHLQVWHILLPGYLIAIALMYVTPKFFIGIAFDAGGVATVPMPATFIVAFMQGYASETTGADVLMDGFGMIALVALIPVITIEILGILYKIKTKKKEQENE
jgi:hypothetical protein